MTASCSAVFAAARFASFHLHATCLSTSDGTLCSTGCASLSISDHRIASLAPHPCPRRPSPDTASTSALVQGQQEGDKRRVRAQSQARAQVPDDDPTPSTTLREPDYHSIIVFLCASILVTHYRSLLIFSRYMNTKGEGGLFPALAIVTGEPLSIEDSSPIPACLLHKGRPLPEVTQSGSYFSYSPG